ncbi:MAG: hypothetical protein V4808_04470 [Pseudomonadota bacterium]
MELGRDVSHDRQHVETSSKFPKLVDVSLQIRLPDTHEPNVVRQELGDARMPK